MQIFPRFSHKNQQRDSLTKLGLHRKKTKKSHRGRSCRPTPEWRSFILKVVKSSWSQPDEEGLRRWARSSRTNDSTGRLKKGWCRARTSSVPMGLTKTRIKKSCSFMLLWVCCFSIFLAGRAQATNLNSKWLTLLITTVTDNIQTSPHSFSQCIQSAAAVWHVVFWLGQDRPQKFTLPLNVI